MVPIILDTDIGTDIDDALCLAYLLAQPRCELVGITTVSGAAEERAMMASALCHVADKPEIPIYPGAPQALILDQLQKDCPQARALGDWPHQKDFPKNEAISFMRQAIHERPGEITLLAIGPMTNVGLLFKTDPEIPSLLKSLVLMCGHFDPAATWTENNAKIDPHATHITYAAKVAQHRSVGIDMTMRVKMNSSEASEKLTSPLFGPVMSFAEVWYQQTHTITFHDPLAAATIFDDSIVKYERASVEVETDAGPMEGRTGATLAPDGPLEIATDVDVNGFFEHYLSVVNGFGH